VDELRRTLTGRNCAQEPRDDNARSNVSYLRHYRVPEDGYCKNYKNQEDKELSKNARAVRV